MTALTFSLLCAFIAIIYGIISIFSIMKKSEGNEEMQRISGAVREGAIAYLSRQYTTIGIVGVVLFLVMGFALGWASAIGFAVGAILSGAAGYIGMHVSVRSNARTAEAAKDGVNALSGCDACNFQNVERVGSKPFERGSAE